MEFLFLIKLQPAIYYEEIPTQVFSCEYCDMFKRTIMKNICERLLLQLEENWTTIFLSTPSRFTVFAAYNIFCYDCQKQLSKGVLQKRRS